MNNEITQYARSIRHGLFAERDTLQEAIKYAETLAHSCATPVAVMTALHVVLNTVAADMIKMAGPRPTEADLDAYRAAANEMTRIGGGFAGSIGEAYLRADSMNAPRLVAAFPELFARYSKEAAL